VFGGWWSAWARVGGVAGCIWLMGTIGVLGCNVGSSTNCQVVTRLIRGQVFGTNIGATILLSRTSARLSERRQSGDSETDTLHRRSAAVANDYT
jgi:hypothetical protein